MEQLQGLKAALTHLASKELSVFERAMKRELAKKDEAHETEVKRLQEQIHVLQQQVSPVNQWEYKLQNTRCCSPNEDHPNSNATPSNTDKQRSNTPQGITRSRDYDELYERFIRCSMELERVKKAMQLLQIHAKRWKDELRSIHRDERGKGVMKPGDPIGRTVRRRSAPEGRPLSRARSVDVMTSVQEDPIHFPQTNSTTADSDLPDVRDQDKQWCGMEKFIHNGPPPEPESRFDQTQDDDDAEIANHPMYHMPQLPQSRGITRSEHDLLVNHKTDDVVKQESDSPVVTKVKTLKRRRGKSPVEAPQKSKRVKEEPLSSSPIILHASNVARGAQESIDLDEIPTVLYTPRKYHGTRWQMNTTPRKQSNSEEHLRQNGDESDMFERADTLLEDIGDDSLLFRNRRSPDRDLDDVEEEARCHEMGKMLTAKLLNNLQSQRRSEARAKQERHNRQARTKHMATEPHNADTENSYQPGRSESSSRAVLQPVEANKAPSKNVSNHRGPSTKPSPSGWHHGAQHIQYLSEDGENMPESDHSARQQGQAADPTTSGELPSSSKRSKPSAEGRLDQLLTRPSPEKPSLSPEKRSANLDKSNRPKVPTKTPKQNPPSTSSETPFVAQRTQSTATKPRTAPQSTAKTPNIPQPPPPTYTTPFTKSSTSRAPAKPNPPLRSRPLSHLSPEDFKVNPAQNQGYSHPFKEVVRSRDQRDCLPGCTRLECCGTIFRQMAETGLIKPFHTKRLFASSQEDENVRLMEDFLGDQAYTLRKMSEGTKAELLLQAKTKILANHYGRRHREVYAREPSPVGFWDVDMPSTQQAEEQVKLAEIRKRQKVEERYREAMRKDGYWKFRDE